VLTVPASPQEAAEQACTDAAADAVAGTAVAPALALMALHPALWRAHQMGAAAQRVTASGFDRLDAQLPGGGWPHGVLTELLLAQPGMGELRLLAPALAALAPASRAGVAAASTSPADDEGRCVMLFDPPASLSAWALVQAGLCSRHWLVVQARSGQAKPTHASHASPRQARHAPPLLPNADVLWALEQSLKSGHVGAVLAWLPLHLRADALRRLQLAAAAHDGPVFIFRDALAASKPSAAPLRLLLQPAGVDGLSLRLLKRRGPPLAQPLRLVLPSALTPGQQAQAITRQAVGLARRPVPAHSR
jgi:protein ImuA